MNFSAMSQFFSREDLINYLNDSDDTEPGWYYFDPDKNLCGPFKNKDEADSHHMFYVTSAEVDPIPEPPIDDLEW